MAGSEEILKKGLKADLLNLRLDKIINENKVFLMGFIGLNILFKYIIQKFC